ncbi:octopamine receptor in mushroom bodies [Tachypleus tridentatus]|uniref:octopamine receptor in mushroom bodies n=1 Tax=Tachypleus tridentatus TaxID=6853 RepID=UPI003FD5A88D
MNRHHTARLLEPQSVLCIDGLSSDRLSEVRVVVSFVILGTINLTVISGNLLVILSVFISAKLRTVTNFFIVSLAVADLLVGIVVLPYSMTLEVLDVWIFGNTWCQIWLAVDVWLCTSSILHLCAISVDRYLAITRPVHYRSIMSSRRAKLLIAAVWVVAFVICFPPLVGWNDSSTGTSSVFPEFGNETFSIHYSAISQGVATSRSTIALDQSVEPKKPGTQYNGSPESWLSGNAVENTIFPVNSTTTCITQSCSLITNKGYVIYSAFGSFYIPMFVMLFFYWRIYAAALKTGRALERGFKTTKSSKGKNAKGEEQRLTLRIHRGHTMAETGSHEKKGQEGISYRRYNTLSFHGKSTRKLQSRTDFDGKTVSTSLTFDPEFESRHSKHYNEVDNPSTSGYQGKENVEIRRRKMYFSRMSRRNIRWHARRFRSETKATKTVGVIVGGFIICWLPFFTVYLAGAFCDQCISQLLFSVFFWLGYCNSAINPFIYALLSKDFRSAFKRLLCRCLVKKESISSLIRQIHLSTFLEENTESG